MLRSLSWPRLTELSIISLVAVKEKTRENTSWRPKLTHSRKKTDQMINGNYPQCIVTYNGKDSLPGCIGWHPDHPASRVAHPHKRRITDPSFVLLTTNDTTVLSRHQARGSYTVATCQTRSLVEENTPMVIRRPFPFRPCIKCRSSQAVIYSCGTSA